MEKFQIKSSEHIHGVSTGGIRPRIKILISLTGVIAVAMLVIVVVNLAIQGGKLSPGFESLEKTMQESLIGGSCEADYCASKPCIITASRILDLLDNTTSPCADFYQYACGNYKRGRALRFNEKSYTPVVEAEDNVLIVLKKILEKPVTDSDSGTQKTAKILYASCGNSTRREEQSENDLKHLFEEVDLVWPVLDKSWNVSTAEWYDIVVKLEELGVHTLFTVETEISWQNPLGKVQVHCTVPTLSREMYETHEGGEVPYIRVMYSDFIDSVLRLLGVDRRKIKVFIEDIMTVETHLAAEDASENSSPEDKPSREILKMLLGRDADLDEMLPRAESICGKSVNEIMNVLGQESRRAVLNYIGWRAVVNVLPYLGANYKNLYDFYIGKFSDSVNIFRSIWRECSAFVRDELGLVAYKSYLDGGNFNESYEEEVREMMTDLKSSFAALFTRVNWLDNNTRSVFFEKLKQVKLNIGYPENVRQNNALDEAFRELHVSVDNSYFQNVIKVKTFIRKLLSSNYHGGNHTNFGHYLNMELLDTQSLYKYNENTIDIHLGLLRSPLMHLGPDFPRYLKYAQVFELGHELSHAFDITGTMYSASGEFEGTGWWPDTVKQKFHEFVSCLIQQETVGTPSRLSQGAATNYQILNDDIADLGALFVTYAGLSIHLRNPQSLEEKQLPGLSLNKKQIYYVQAAQNFCEIREYQPAPARHLPNDRSRKQTINAAISNMEDFGAVFNCPAGSPMNPSTKCNLLN